jgi:hypothetical protein
LEWWVDAEEYSIIDMEKDGLKHFTWSSNQEANFWFANQKGQTTRLATDQELLTLLRVSKIVKFIMTVDRCEHVDVALNATHMEAQSQVADEDNGLQIQVAGNNNAELQQVFGKVVVAEFEGQEWVDEPELGVSAAGPARVEEEEEMENYMDHGFDPEGDDPTGADEEWRYFKKPQKEKKKVEKRGRVYEGIDAEVVPSDEAMMMKDDVYAAHTTYDRDNPDIKKGSTFVDKDAFILIVKQYAIKREFQTFVEHSDTTRYRARCADPACESKIYAKKLLGCPTFMVCHVFITF